MADTERCFRDAVISADGRYRYSLSRSWTVDQDAVLWIMLNPSTADADVDDPTIRRCMAFSKRFGFGGMCVGNLYAFRSTDPAMLWGMGARDARGPDNAEHLQAMANRCSQIICAWGVGGGPGWPLVLGDLQSRNPMCLGRTKHGAPRHPLYVPNTQEREPYCWTARTEGVESKTDASR